MANIIETTKKKGLISRKKKFPQQNRSTTIKDFDRSVLKTIERIY